MGRDKYGHYTNDEEIELRASIDKYGKDHIDIYDRCPAENDDHDSIHIDYDSNTGKGTIVDTTDGDKETTDTQCYLTSACMRYFQKSFDDNCYELTVLRWFRDKFVSKEDIDHYYEVAPVIVESINKEEQANIIYEYIYENIVDYCVKQIEKENYDEAYSRYKISVIVLEKQFAKPALINRFVKTLKLKINN